MKKFGNTIIALFILTALWYLVIFIGWAENYSDGKRTGDIYKLSQKGLIYKSWEGEMYLGGIRQTGGKAPTLELDRFYFSIPGGQAKEKQELIDKINKCSEERILCTIKYKQWLKRPIYISSDYVVVGVEIQ